MILWRLTHTHVALSDVTYLNAEALALLQDYPLPPAMEVPDLAADAVLRDAASVRAQFEDDDNEPSRASRIVHIGSTGTQEGPSTPGSSSDTTTAKKLPKWLKLSK